MTARKNTFYLAVSLLLSLVSLSVQAHAPRENYVWVNVEEDHVSGRFEVNVNDLANKLNINIDENADTRLEGIALNAEQVQQYLLDNFSMTDSTGEIPFGFVGTGISEEADEFAQYYFKSDRLPSSVELTLTNTVFMGPELARDDRLHRSLIVLEYDKASGKDYGLDTPVLVFSPKISTAVLNTANPSKVLQWDEFLKQGVLHIWLGLDHVLFILVLLLTTVLVVKQNKWEPIENFKGAFIKTLKIITLFTIAHSITLTLAAFDLVSLNSAFIETIIAVSIIAIALNNIYPVINSHAWVLVFVFGLFHGLGFASVMADLQFRTVLLGRILLMFNIGVEIGQFVIVALVFPVFYLLRKSDYYRNGVVVPVSVLAILLAGYWVVERTGLINYVT